MAPDRFAPVIPRRTLPTGTLTTVIGIVVLAAAVVARLIWLGNIPGINGDEAFYSTALLRFKEGETLPLMAPSGRPLSLTYYLSTWLCTGGLTAVNVWTMRLPALLWGIALLGLAWHVAKEKLSPGVSVSALLLMACLPLNIIYSRVGWDPSQIVVACLLILYLAWCDKWLWLLVLFPAAIWNIHPTIVMMAPVVVCMIWGGLLENRTLPLGRKIIPIAGTAAIVAGIGFICIRSVSSPYRVVDKGAAFTLSRLPEFYDFFLSYVSGVAPFREFGATIGPHSASVHKGVAAAVIGAAFATAAAATYRRKQWRALGLVCGTFIMIHSVLLIPNFLPFARGYSRYGLVTLAPLCFVVLLALSALDVEKRARQIALGACIALCVAMLWSFSVNFLGAFRTTSGASLEANATWQAGARDPKLQVYEWIQGEKKREGPQGKTVVLVTDDSLYNVLELFAVRDKAFTLLSLRNVETARQLVKYEGDPAVEKILIVDFLDDLLDDYFAKRRRNNISLIRGFYGYNGVLVLKAWEMKRPFLL